VNGHDARVAIVRAIAEVDPAAVNDAIDHLDRTTVDETPILAALVRHALRSGDVAAGDHAAMREWMARHG
jgi:hypothetical protein